MGPGEGRFHDHWILFSAKLCRFYMHNWPQGLAKTTVKPIQFDMHMHGREANFVLTGDSLCRKGLASVMLSFPLIYCLLREVFQFQAISCHGALILENALLRPLKDLENLGILSAKATMSPVHSLLPGCLATKSLHMQGIVLPLLRSSIKYLCAVSCIICRATSSVGPYLLSTAGGITSNMFVLWCHLKRY